MKTRISPTVFIYLCLWVIGVLAVIQDYVYRSIRSLRGQPVNSRDGYWNGDGKTDAMRDKNTDEPCQTEQQSWTCKNMEPIEGDTSMEYEYYECKICSRRMKLDYEEMK